MLKKSILFLFLVSKTFCSDKNESRSILQSTLSFIEEYPIQTLCTVAGIGAVGYSFILYKEKKIMEEELLNAQNDLKLLESELQKKDDYQYKFLSMVNFIKHNEDFSFRAMGNIHKVSMEKRKTTK